MWSRRELKARGKAAFKSRYWMCVAIALIMTLILGGGAGVMAGSAGSRIDLTPNSGNTSSITENVDIPELPGGFGDVGEAFGHLKEVLAEAKDSGILFAVIALVAGVLLVAGLVSLLLKLLLLNPLEVGCQNFFLRNSEGSGQLNDLERGFTPAWGNNVKTMFLRGLFLALWSLLFVIPGIVKAYSYRMVPFILSDHPEMRGTEVITLSRQMMRGQKWRAFVLDLSFLGWHILSLLTIGILGVFYVAPYKRCTDAELYQALKREQGI